MMRGWGGPPRAVDDDDRLDRQQATKVLRRTIAMLRPYRREAVAASVVLVLSTACLLAGPALVRYGIDQGLRRNDGAALNKAALAYVAVAIGALVLGRAQIRLVAQVGERFLRDLRLRVFDHLLSLSLDFYGGEQTGRLVARMTSDIDALTELVQMGLVMFVTNVLLLVGSIIAIFILSPPLALLCVLALPPVIVASVRFQRRSNQAYLLVRDRIGQTLSTLQEDLSGVRVIQAFAREEIEEQRFRRHNSAQLDANLAAARVASWYFPVVELSGVVAVAAVIGVGGVLVDRGQVTVGVVAAFVLYLGNLFEPIQQLSQLFNSLQSAGAALAKLFGLLDTAPTVFEHPGAVDVPVRAPIVVEGVGFSYDGRTPVLRGVDLRIEPGERLALVGPTGAGKSTLAKLIARLHDPTEGQVSFGEVDLRLATLASLRQRVVVVPQEGFLFNGTIRDNVRVGRMDATDAEVDAALRVIGAFERFTALPQGLDTEVRERGSRLSAGERQLVSLARAALSGADVIVLDEATSNLDPGTEADVERAMARLMEDRTVVVIAHRLSTAERADRVAVVDRGRLVEVGTHAELLANGGHYSALFASWTGPAAGT